MRRPKPNWRAVKIHRSYTVDELARTIGVAKGTVRRWLKSGLVHLADQKPVLILGSDARAFHAAKKPRKQKCKPGELYCVKCRAPRTPADGEIELVPLKSGAVNLRGLCPDCTTLMHRRAARAHLDRIKEHFEVSNPQGFPTLMDTEHTPSNVHLQKEPATYGKAPPRK